MYPLMNWNAHPILYNLIVYSIVLFRLLIVFVFDSCRASTMHNLHSLLCFPSFSPFSLFVSYLYFTSSSYSHVILLSSVFSRFLLPSFSCVYLSLFLLSSPTPLPPLLTRFPYTNPFSPTPPYLALLAYLVHRSLLGCPP